MHSIVHGTVDTDASGFATGAVLSQKQDDGTVRPVAYTSGSLSQAEKNYSVTRKELLATYKPSNIQILSIGKKVPDTHGSYGIEMVNDINVVKRAAPQVERGTPRL